MDRGGEGGVAQADEGVADDDREALKVTGKEKAQLQLVGGGCRRRGPR